MDSIQDDYALQQAVNLSSASNLPSLLSISPQTVIVPVSYTIVNVVPFNQPVYDFVSFHLFSSYHFIFLYSASAVTFVGLIYSLILSFFVVVSDFHSNVSGVFLNAMIYFQVVALGAREASRLNQLLRYRSIVIVRLVSSFTAYFFLSVCRAPLNRRKQIDEYFSSSTHF